MNSINNRCYNVCLRQCRQEDERDRRCKNKWIDCVEHKKKHVPESELTCSNVSCLFDELIRPATTSTITVKKKTESWKKREENYKPQIRCICHFEALRTTTDSNSQTIRIDTFH